MAWLLVIVLALLSVGCAAQSPASPDARAATVEPAARTRLAPPRPVSALAPETARFSGAVSGGAVAGSARVQAVVNGVVCGEGTITRAPDGVGVDYVVDVRTAVERSGCGRIGDSVRFRVGSVAAREVGVFQPGVSALLDLSSAEPDPTPTPQAERRWGSVATQPTSSPAPTCDPLRDAGFGWCGRVTTAFGDATGGGWAALALQADAKIVAAGGGGRVALARYTRDGALDATFGEGGRVTTSVGSGAAWATAVAIQADGAIVVAGGNADGIAVARFTSSGALDQTFGVGGAVTITVPSVTAVATAIAVQSDGRIVVAGQAGGVVLARLLPDGTPDQTFGRAGIVLTRVSGMLAGARSLAIQRDGALVVAGWFGIDTHGVALGAESDGFLLLRYVKDGTPDAAFGDGGRVQTAIGPRAGGEAVLLQPDGRIVVAGGNNGVYAVARYLPSGALDPSLGSGGIGRTALGTTREGDGWHALVLLPDGSLLTAGDSAGRIALARHTATGQLDPSFGSGGWLLASASGWAASGSLLLQPDGKPLLGGTADGDFLVMRYVAMRDASPAPSPIPTLTATPRPSPTPRPSSTPRATATPRATSTAAARTPAPTTAATPALARTPSPQPSRPPSPTPRAASAVARTPAPTRPPASASPRSASPTPVGTPRPSPVTNSPLPDLTPTVFAVPGRMQAGAAASVRVGAVNLGPGDARSVTVRVTLSGGSVITAAASVGFGCTTTGMTGTCTGAALTAANMAIIDMIVAVPPAPGALAITIQVDPDSTVSEMREENNVVSLSVAVE